MLKPRFCVTLSTGIHLSQKKLSEHSNMLQNACVGGTYVSTPQVGVHPAHFES